MVLGAAFIAGFGLLGLSILRARSFDRFVAQADPAPARVQKAADRLAIGLGMSRRPRVFVVPACIPPTVWPSFPAARIVIPQGLLERLDGPELDAVLLHELSHIRRGDHLARLLELVVGTLYWWYPLTWLVRRALRSTEEQCCDARVVSALRGGARTYAESLCKTMEFLASTDAVLPAAATGIGEFSRMKARLLLIMKRTPHRPLPRPIALLVAVAAVAVLVAFPTGAIRAKAPEAVEQSSTHVPPDMAMQAPEDLLDVLLLLAAESGTNIAIAPGVDAALPTGIAELPADLELRVLIEEQGLVAVDRGDHLRIFPDTTVAAGHWLEDGSPAPVGVEGAGPNIALKLKNADIRSVLDWLASVAGHPIVVDECVEGEVTMWVHDVSWERVVAIVVESLGFLLIRDDDHWRVTCGGATISD